MLFCLGTNYVWCPRRLSSWCSSCAMYAGECCSAAHHEMQSGQSKSLPFYTNHLHCLLEAVFAAAVDFCREPLAAALCLCAYAFYMQLPIARDVLYRKKGKKE
ncbi:unnamed protein product, partial [Ixodes pacificus]